MRAERDSGAARISCRGSLLAYVYMNISTNVYSLLCPADARTEPLIILSNNKLHCTGSGYHWLIPRMHHTELNLDMQFCNHLVFLVRVFFYLGT